MGDVVPQRGSAGVTTGIPARATSMVSSLYLSSSTNGLMLQHVTIETIGFSIRACLDPAIISAILITLRIPSTVYTPPMMCLLQ